MFLWGKPFQKNCLTQNLKEKTMFSKTQIFGVALATFVAVGISACGGGCQAAIAVR